MKEHGVEHEIGPSRRQWSSSLRGCAGGALLTLLAGCNSGGGGADPLGECAGDCTAEPGDDMPGTGGGADAGGLPATDISLVEEGWTDDISFGCNQQGRCITVIPGFRYRIYENAGYRCGADDGNYQFMVIDRGEETSATRHLFAKFPGGGVGFYYDNGSGGTDYYGQASILTAQYARNTFFRTSVSEEFANGLTRRIRESGEFRILIMSYCSHDFYFARGECSDQDGFCRYGYLAASEALAHVRNEFATAETITHGGSAGAANFFVAVDQPDIAGIIMDSQAGDLGAIHDACIDGVNVFGNQYPCFCPDGGSTCMALLASRIGFEMGEDEPYLRVERDQIDTPIYLIWNERDGSNAAHLQYDRLHSAILDHNPGGDSRVNIDGRTLCITNPDSPPGPICNLHVPSGVDHDQPVTPSDNTTASELVDDVYAWVQGRVGSLP